jgi:hypothetical protein
MSTTYREEYDAKYSTMRAAAVSMVDDPIFKRMVDKCQQNPWLKVGGIDFEDNFCCEHDYPYYLERYDSPAMLQMFFEHGNWGTRCAVMYRDLIFVQQVNGGDEWWTLKIDGERLVAFESITWAPLIQRGEFESMLNRMVNASVETCKKLDY